MIKDGKTTSAQKAIVIGEEAEKLGKIYQEAFAIFSLRTPCLQNYHPEEFQDVLKDREIIKLISYIDGEPVGMALITSNLNKVPWINKSFYTHNFPEHYRKGMLFYVKSILVTPRLQDVLAGEEKTRIITKLIKLIETFLPEDSIFCYDCSSELNEWFTDFLVKTTPSVHPLGLDWRKGIDRQVYFAFRKNYEEGYGGKTTKQRSDTK